jgi:hypothetical protein
MRRCRVIESRSLRWKSRVCRGRLLHRHVCARVLSLFALCALGRSQFLSQVHPGFYDHTPNTRAVVSGRDTVLGYRLSRDARMVLGSDSPSGRVLIRLPAKHRQAVPELLGMLRHGSDIEVFLGWVDPESGTGNGGHHIEIFRGSRGAEASLVHDFDLAGGGDGEIVSFFEPPDSRDTPEVFIDIQGGAYWGTTYLLAPRRQSVVQLFTASDYELADLDRDGVYELIAWNRRPFDVRCMFGIFDVRYYPEVFVRAGASYREVWPPSSWAARNGELENRFRQRERDGVPWGANLQIVAGFADLTGDGVADLIVLQDHLQDEPNQALAVYRFENKSFRLVARAPLPPQRIAYLVSGIRDTPDGKEILVRTATPARCKAGFYDSPIASPDNKPTSVGTAETAYMLHGDRLQPVRTLRR